MFGWPAWKNEDAPSGVFGIGFWGRLNHPHCRMRAQKQWQASGLQPLFLISRNSLHLISNYFRTIFRGIGHYGSWKSTRWPSGIWREYTLYNPRIPWGFAVMGWWWTGLVIFKDRESSSKACDKWFHRKQSGKAKNQWIGWREHLQRTMVFPMKCEAFLQNFP